MSDVVPEPDVIDSELLSFAESQGRANMDFHLFNADHLNKEANTLLAVLLAGAGGGLALAVSSAKDATILWPTYAIAAGSLYLFAVAALTVWKCLHIKDIEAPANEPGNLFPHDATALMVRRAELRNLQVRIRANIERNRQTSMWLNISRYLATATPVISALVGMAAY